MELLFPAALALGLLAAPIIALYMLRLRRHEQRVSSTLLWRELVLDRAANAPWQRLRRNLLLFLQLLILAALVFALARPIFKSGTQARGDVFVLLDTSASMGTTDGLNGPRRFDDALTEVNRLIDELGANNRMTIIAAGSSPRILSDAIGDDTGLRSSLKTLAPENGSADWQSAFALVSGLTQAANEPKIVLISDGNLPEDLPALPGELTFIPVGQSGDNLAISALGARSSDEGMNTLVSVTNTGTTPAQARVGIYVDNNLFDAREIEIQAGESARASWMLPPTAGIIEARLESIGGSIDHLPIDDRVWQLGAPPEGQQIQFHSDGNLFLERFFSILPGYDFVHADEGSKSGNDSTPSAAFTIFDGVPLPESLPPGNLLIINPQAGSDPAAANPAIAVTGTFTETGLLRQTDSPILTDVNRQNIHVASAQTVSAPGLEPLLEAEGGPLLLAGEVDGRRIVLITFDIRQSDLPLQIAFPILMANITEWLSPGRAMTTGAELAPGTVVHLLPDERASTIVVTLPDGKLWEQKVEGDLSPVRFDATSQTGVYTVSTRDENGITIRESHFVVNFINDRESHIQPRPSVLIGQAQISSTDTQNTGERELWPILLWAGFFLLMIEWWIAYRRRTNQPLSGLQ